MNITSNLYKRSLALICFSIALAGCSGTGSNNLISGSNSTPGADDSASVTEPSNPDNPETTDPTDPTNPTNPTDPETPVAQAGPVERGTNAAGETVAELGAAVSRSALTDYANSLTTGSGEVLVNLGSVVTSSGITLSSGLGSLDGDYVNETGAGLSQTTTDVGSTVVSVGDTVAQLDALPVFVQLNEKTGVLTYSGKTVSELGGKVEQVGDALEFHFSDENGGLYGLSQTLSITTAPIIAEVDGILDMKGNALILFENKADIKPTVEQLVYVTGGSLKAGTKALLSDKKGIVKGVGEVLVGNRGLAAVLVSDQFSDQQVLASLDSKLGGITGSDGDQVLVDSKGDLRGLIANVGSSKAIVTSNVSGLIESVTQPDQDNILTSLPVLDSITNKLVDSGSQDNPLNGVLAGLNEATGSLGLESNSDSGLVDDLSDGLNKVNNGLLGKSEGPVTSTLNQTLNTTLQTESDSEKAGLVDNIDNNLLDPIAGGFL